MRRRKKLLKIATAPLLFFGSYEPDEKPRNDSQSFVFEPSNLDSDCCTTIQWRGSGEGGVNFPFGRAAPLTGGGERFY